VVSEVKTSQVRTLLAGVAGGCAINLVMLMTFRFFGLGTDGKGILLNPEFQIRKLIAVWTELEPLPLVVNRPLPIILGIIGFGIVHAYLYRWLCPSWPTGVGTSSKRSSSTSDYGR
jgi:hypothetical protein